jgi:nucleoside-diphosphate-sugar epimerase
MKTLITGGCGFIGSHLVEQLVKQGIATTVYLKKYPLATL